jgi:SOS-response transcriptional repressor LexA
MNPLQKKILNLADSSDLGTRTYYGIAKELGVDHPFKVKFALDQLEKRGLLVRNKRTGQLTKVSSQDKFGGLISIPVYGDASCGPAVAYADNTVTDFLKVSQSYINAKNLNRILAVKAVGNSMNRANIQGSPINNGDYVLVEKSDGWPNVKTGDYVVSMIEGMANIKRYVRDDANRRILLLSESFEDAPPILIAQEDLEDDLGHYEIIGKVVQVVPSSIA